MVAQSTLAAKVAESQGSAPKRDESEMEPALDSVDHNEALMPIVQWLSQLSPSFDAILEELNEIDEKTTKTDEKLKSLLEVAETKLKKSSVVPSAAQLPTVATATSSAAASSSSSSSEPKIQARPWQYQHRR